MHGVTSFLLATLAAVALSAPTPPTKALAKRSFKVPAKGNAHLDPFDEMYRAYRKHGWEIIVLDPSGQYQGSPALEPSAAAPPGYGSPSQSSPPFPYQSDSSPGYGGSPSGDPTLSTGVPSSPSGTSPLESSGPLPPLSSGLVGTSSGSSPVASSTGSPTGDGETGEVTASPEKYESEYLSPVSIGGQTLNLNFDTGSADLWVFSSRLPQGEDAGHSLYSPEDSKSFAELEGATWQIQYGDGSTASGTVGYDEVSIGDATVTKQAVELATSVSNSFLADENSDGLLGLAFSTINTIQPRPQKTFFENIQDQLDEPLFTADLEEDASGTYEFGTIDKSKYSGEMHYTDIDASNGWWQFPAETFTVGGQEQQCGYCSPAIADTGTSLLLLDDDIVEAYYSQVQGAQIDSMQGGYVFPCNAKLPEFGLAIGTGYTAVLTGEEMVYAEINTGSCFGSLQGNGVSQGSQVPVQIIGAALLKQYFAVFDGGNMRFGIAKKN